MAKSYSFPIGRCRSHTVPISFYFRICKFSESSMKILATKKNARRVKERPRFSGGAPCLTDNRCLRLSSEIRVRHLRGIVNQRLAVVHVTKISTITSSSSSSHTGTTYSRCSRGVVRTRRLRCLHKRLSRRNPYRIRKQRDRLSSHSCQLGAARQRSGIAGVILLLECRWPLRILIGQVQSIVFASSSSGAAQVEGNNLALVRAAVELRHSRSHAAGLGNIGGNAALGADVTAASTPSSVEVYSTDLIKRRGPRRS